MVGDNHRDAGAADRLGRTGAAVHGDDQLRRVLLDALGQRGRGQAVAIVEPVRDERGGLGAERAQHADQQRGAGQAVGIVIAEDDDLLVRGQRLGDARDGGGQVRQQLRLGEVAQAHTEKFLGGGHVAITPGGQQARDGVGQAQCRGQRGGQLLIGLGQTPYFFSHAALLGRRTKRGPKPNRPRHGFQTLMAPNFGSGQALRLHSGQ